MTTADYAVQRLWMRAQRYLDQGQLSAARAAWESMLARDPEHPRTHLIQSHISLAADHMREATQQALTAAGKMSEPDATLVADVVDGLIAVGEVVQARRYLDHPALAHVASSAMIMRIAIQRQTLGEHAAALDLLERAHAAGNANCDVHFYRGVQLAFAGRLEEAEQELKNRVRMEPLSGRSFVELARLRRWSPQRNHLELLERCLERVESGSEDHAALEFSRYKELEDMRRYDEAWQALDAGNGIMHARLRYVSGAEKELFDRLAGLCTAQFSQTRGVSHDGAKPIFIVGLPRSGSTLLDRMLGSHSQVASAGELSDFGRQLNWSTGCRALQGAQAVNILSRLDYEEIGRRYLAQTQWRASDRPFFIDKQPSNWILAGLIHRALPEARILNIVRDPMDVCFSNYRAYFGNAYAYSYNLATLAAYHHSYRRLISHWHEVLRGRIVDVHYTDLVHEPEAAIRRVLDFCGLEWEAGCTDISRNQTPVATLSLAQARSRIRTDAFAEWRRYETQLSGLAAALAESAAGMS